MEETKQCQNCKNDFKIESEDFAFYDKIHVPAPTFCPECRMIRRLRNRNERVLFKAQCDLCSKSIFTIYHPDNKYIIYCTDCYSSDKWNPLDYGMDYDFSRSFFEQFSELQKRVPHKAKHEVSSQNCEYGNYILNSKDIYLSFTTTDSNWIYYTRSADRCNDCMDCYNIIDCQYCYFCVQTSKSSNSSYLIDCRECVSSKFLYDCVNCIDCFMSSNVRNKQYYFKNKQLTKEEYKNEMDNLDFSSLYEISNLKIEFDKLVKNSIHKFANLTGSNNCTGDNVVKSNNVNKSFHVTESENCKFVMRTVGLKDSYDVFGSLPGELLYEVHGGAKGSSNSHFVSIGNGTVNSEYTDFCLNVQDLFGSVSLQSNKYCIFNKQYEKDEYFELKEKIKQQMMDVPYIDEKGIVYKYGEYFPQICMAFAYNESAAQEFFPLTKEEIIHHNYLYRDPIVNQYSPTLTKENLPNKITDSIVDEVLECSHNNLCNSHRCVGVFKITKEELFFYKNHNISLPNLCPNCRHYERLLYVHMPKLYKRKCSNNCGTEFETSYSPDRPEIVYCESCYQQEVI